MCNPLLPAQLTSLPDLSAHKLHRPPDARTVGNIQQDRLQSGGGRCRQIRLTFLCETRGYDVKTFSIQLPGQEVPKAAVTACDEHVLLGETVHLVGVSDGPADGEEGGQQEDTSEGRV